MEFKIDIKIFLIALVFLLVNQIYMYILFMIFAIIHECFHLLAGIILGYKVKSIRIMPLGLSIAFNEKEEEYNAKIRKSNFNNVKKIYKMGDVKIKALAGASFTIEKGEFAVIAGPSGAGKSTILNLLGGMDTATTGEIIVDGQHVNEMDAKQLTAYRRYDIGFVFQFYNLVQNLTARENVELAAQICKDPLDIDKTLDAVGLSDRKKNFPAQLSGGEQQRVAIARALAKNPKILLCDEPTGALDYQTGKAVLKLLQDTCIKHGVTVVVITHNLALTPMGNKVIRVKNGVISDVTVNENPVPIDEIEW